MLRGSFGHLRTFSRELRSERPDTRNRGPVSERTTCYADFAGTGRHHHRQWDRLRIDQALTNLLSNAVKYGSQKPVGISASSDGSRVTVKVRDAGMGISEDELPRIFGRFERLNTRSMREGLGLGLWIAKVIVEAHGGAILAESEVGKGSVFTVTLPLG